MSRHQLICDKCRVKFPCSIAAMSTATFVRKHDEHNYPTGLRIELVECPSPRRSKLYKLAYFSAHPRPGPKEPLP